MVVMVVCVMLAPDADAGGHGRRAAGSGFASSPSLHGYQNRLALLPDSALSMPASLRMGPLLAGSRSILVADFSAAAPRPVPSLGKLHKNSLANGVRQGYDRFCDTMSAKLWDEPNGRRLSFDSHGKPGVAVEIPLH